MDMSYIEIQTTHGYITTAFMTSLAGLAGAAAGHSLWQVEP